MKIIHHKQVAEILNSIEFKLSQNSKKKELNTEFIKESIEAFRSSSLYLNDLPCYENPNFKSLFALQVLITPKKEWPNLLTFYFYRQPVNFSQTYFNQIEQHVFILLKSFANEKISEEFKKEYESWKKYFNYVHQLKNHYFETSLNQDKPFKLTKSQSFACKPKDIPKIREEIQECFEDFELGKLDDFLNFFCTDLPIVIRKKCVAHFLEQVSFHIKVKELLPELKPRQAKSIIKYLFRVEGEEKSVHLIEESSFKKYFDPTIARLVKKENNKLKKSYMVDRRSDPMGR